MAFLTPDDLETFVEGIPPAKAHEMIDDASALAKLAAPCLGDGDLTDDQLAAVKAVLRGAILRWHDAGTGAVQSETAGPFSRTYAGADQRRGLFFPSEIEQLRTICRSTETLGGIFSIDTAPCLSDAHADTCSLRFGAAYCSCGVDIAGFPLYEIS